MKDEDRFKLHFGPYYPPKVRRGGRLFDEIHGTVIVRGYSDGQIPWPKRKGANSLILCGDLVKAVRRESKLAICHWWGVSKTAVARWRRALGVGRITEGTSRLHSAHGKEPHRVQQFLQRTSGKAADPVFRAKLANRRKRLRQFSTRKRVWTKEETVLLGTMLDRELAERLNCSIGIVRMERRRLGIPALIKKSLPRNRLRISPGKLMARRLALGLSRRTLAARADVPGLASQEQGIARTIMPEAAERLAAVLKCRVEDILYRGTPTRPRVPDDSLLGTMQDVDLAKKWRVPLDWVYARRTKLGIPSFRMQSKPPLPDDTLLGTMRDKELAAMWGVPVARVVYRRKLLGIPGFERGRCWRVRASHLRKLRRQIGLSQVQVAAQANVSSSHYWHVETGNYQTVSNRTAQGFAAALNCRVEDFATPLFSDAGGGEHPAAEHGVCT